MTRLNKHILNPQPVENGLEHDKRVATPDEPQSEQPTEEKPKENN